jgi:D-beta-D-heptose 7-phosphate kinase/D-beta-D-heptose 1-phosphate adenosyltransferase
MREGFADLTTVVDGFAGLSILVVGEAMLDSYLLGDAAGVCREAPVPIVRLSRREDVPGGAANAAANAARLGASVRFLSGVGADLEGQLLLEALHRRDVPGDDVLVLPDRTTLTKRRLVASEQMLVRFDTGSTEPLAGAAEDDMLKRLAAAHEECDCVLVSDYGYGILTPRVIAELTRLQAATPRALVVDAKDLTSYRRTRVSAVKPNYAEARALLGLPPDVNGAARAQVLERGEEILELTGAALAAVTLDTEGAVVFERGRPSYRTFARPASHARAAGAGDTFAAVLCLALAAGAVAPAAADLASSAAAIVVSANGTTACSRSALREAVAGERKRLTATELAERLARHRELDRRIVFTNGCFDILHRGHVAYLSRAKELGDVLIVAVNSDASVARLKGPGRPINPLDDRLSVLAALSCVDHVVPFEDDTPVELIRTVRPDVFVKGGDYARAALPEADAVEELGGRVEILPYVHDRSTSNMITRIRSDAMT